MALGDMFAVPNLDGTDQWRIDESGHLIPGVDNTNNIGDATHQIKGLYVKGTVNIPANSIKQAELSYSVISVTVLATATTGTGAVVANAIILGIYPTGNQDQFVDNVAISGTTLTVTLAAAATADNTFNVAVLNV